MTALESALLEVAEAEAKNVGGQTVMVISVEDLIFMKLASERPKDIEDARMLIRRHRQTLDRGYLQPRLKELSVGLARPDIWAIYETELGASESTT